MALFNAALLAALIMAGGAEGRTLRLLALGDSLTAGYGLPGDQALPARLEAALRAAGHDVTVINAGVSGDTSAGGRARLAWALADRPDAVIVALGANDGLRGLAPRQMRDNLDAILAELGRRGVPVLLAGMLAPPNWGSDYGEEFRAVYGELAARHGALLYPFLLDGVAANPALNQADGIHPNPAGVAVIVERLLPLVRELLGRVAS
ncbi:MAG: arylesterase [Thalassobaculales bacterium]